jgi:hypothetical protein
MRQCDVWGRHDADEAATPSASSVAPFVVIFSGGQQAVALGECYSLL